MKLIDWKKFDIWHEVESYAGSILTWRKQKLAIMYCSNDNIIWENAWKSFDKEWKELKRKGDYVDWEDQKKLINKLAKENLD